VLWRPPNLSEYFDLVLFGTSAASVGMTSNTSLTPKKPSLCIVLVFIQTDVGVNDDGIDV